MQEAIVFVLVLIAALYALWRFMPARWRLRLAARMGLSAKTAQAGSCHACDDCAGCGRPPGPRNGSD